MVESAFLLLPFTSRRAGLRLTFTGFAIFVCIFGGVSIASAQRHKPLPKEELEIYDDPPAAFFQTGLSPGMHSTYDAFTSRQVNVNASGQNITGDAANEPSICVDPTNHNKMAIGWRQFNTVTSNFRQSGYGYTFDGGSTWFFPGVLENNVFRSDPVLFADDIGRFYYNSLLQTFFDNIWRSLDSGLSWTNLQGAGNATGGDKQWYIVDNTSSTGHGFHYQAWSTGGNNFGGRQFSRSTDGGVTWMNPVNITNSPAWGTLDVDTNGNLFIGGVNLNSGQIWCDRSSNAKSGAVTPSFDQSVAVNLGGDISSSEPINPVGLVGQIFLAVDRSGTSSNNNVYMLASVIPTGFTTGSDVMFVRSTNGGLTFSTPKRINDDPVNHSKWHWMSTFSVAPNGRIDALWLDTRNAANNTDSQLFYSSSTDAGVTWSQNVAVSNSFNPFLGYPQQNKMGDYLTSVSDNTGADVAYTATFNNEEDIYYVRVAPEGGPSPTPTGTPTNTPTNTATSTPTSTPAVTPTESCMCITGTVTYGNTATPPVFISNATVSSTAGTPSVFTTTAAPGPIAGQYTLTGFGAGNYTISPSKTGGQNGISSNDAARIAQHVAGINMLTSNNQKVTADVSDNGTISSNDAALIARYAVGVGEPFGNTGTWRFFIPPGPTFPVGASPTSRSYAFPFLPASGQDYIGILMGDVTGNWTNTDPLDLKALGPERTVTIELPQIVTQPDKEIIVPVTVQGIADTGVISYEFDLRYDPSVIQPLAEPVEVKGTVSRGLSVIANAEVQGLLRVVMYGAMPIEEDGLLVNLRFMSVGTAGSGSVLSFERIMVNEGEPSVTAGDGRVELF